MMLGFRQAMMQGIDHMLTFIVVFSMTQSVGGLVGTALLGSIQQQRAQLYTQAIARALPTTDVQLNQRLAQTQSSYSRYLTDPMLRQAQSRAQLQQVVQREASVMAFNDVFRAIGAMSLSFLAWAFYNWLRLRFLAWRARRANRNPSPSSPPASPAPR